MAKIGLRWLVIVGLQLNVGRHATTVICNSYGLIDCRLAPNIGLEEQGFKVSEIVRFPRALKHSKRETLKPAPIPAEAGSQLTLTRTMFDN